MGKGYGAQQDEHPKSVEVRWDPHYSDQDFVPDRSEPFTSLAASYDNLGKAAAHAKAALAKAIPTTWTGDAATACTTYITQLGGYLQTVADAMNTSCTATKTAGGSITEAIGLAKSGTSKANDAQDEHKKKDNGFFDTIMEMIDLNTGVSTGNKARGDALTASQTLASALNGPDHALAAEKDPEIPNPLSAHDPEQAALLAEIMQPVSAALAADGDTGRAKSAVDDYNRTVANDPKAAAKLLAKYAGVLTPAEYKYLLDHLSEDDLAKGFGALDPKTDRDTYNAIAAAADVSILNRLGDDDPNHYWHPATGGEQYVWSNDGYTAGQVPSSSLDDLNQGQLGDCHFLASLGAIEQAHPGWLASHIKANGNGTYTVTLYKDGQPVQVVVSPDTPNVNGADGTPYGSAYAGSPSVYALYEKALAQTNAELGPENRTGYDGMNGGWSNKDMNAILGHEGDNKDPDDVSPQDIQDSLNAHRPVTISTPEYDDKPDLGKTQTIVGGHQYYVKSIDVNSHPPRVTLVNPWHNDNAPPDPSTGQTQPADGTITLTWDQFQKYTSGVQTGDVP